MSDQPQHPTKLPLELLAPAGDSEALKAAVDSGADAVYLGLQTLNARRGAKNFTPEQLPALVADAHARNVRIYLTLNIDITQREIGQAVRILKLAQDAGVDAVLVRDPAIIGLRRFFPALQFHFSTQTCIANSADVLAAGELGASRVVLARELSLAEISACSKAGEVETEVFVQGALCFCISGRCLLSSWTGGRSGNRGTCTSPCRVPWSADQQPLGTPLSMKDLSAVHRLPELQAAGVKALKIEGRLKSGRWVGQAVSLFTQALQQGDPQALLKQAGELGAYAGRPLTDGFLDGRHDSLIAQAAGRQSSSSPAVSAPAPTTASPAAKDEPDDLGSYDLTIDVTDIGIVCTCQVGDASTSWTLPKTVVHRVRKAITIERTLAWLKTMPIQESRLDRGSTNSPSFLLVPRAANALPDQISTALRQLARSEDDVLRLDLPDELRAVLAKPTRHPAAKLQLGDRPDRVRLESRQVAEFVRRLKAPGRPSTLPAAIIVEQVTPEHFDKLLIAAAGIPLIIALPAVMFEADLPDARQIIQKAVAAKLTIEVNSWGALRLARESGALIEAGPALGILNTLAARMLQDQGCQSVSMALEADRRQMEDVAVICPAPLSITVFGRPALMLTRVKLPQDQVAGRMLEDRRGVQLKARPEQGLWALRPADPFDIRGVRNHAIRAAHLVADLVASPNPAEEWLRPPQPTDKPLRFNYGRALA